MRSPPEGLLDADIVTALADGWGIEASSIAYLPVGAGSHHWRVHDRRDRRWFVTVDDLVATQHDRRGTRADAVDHLTAALATAHALEGSGAEYVVAPIAALTGAVVRRIGDDWALAVYPLIDGETFRGGERLPLADRLAVVEMIARLHTGPMPSPLPARSDDHRLPNRADLEAAIADADGPISGGAASVRLAALLSTHGTLIADMLAQYDDAVTRARAADGRAVLTHGEPHAGNTMRTPSGWLLIDWDTALLAAPERDLWLLEPGDGAASAAYSAATGIELRPELLALFRLRWDLTDLGVYVARLRSTHTNNADDARSWDSIADIIARRDAGDRAPPAAWR